jgi:RimJ/RimL family protein N-acetyltransferase
LDKEGILHGNYINLEPMEGGHAEGLVSASVPDNSLYQWSPVPNGKEEVIKYIQTAIDLREAGSALPFVIIRVEDGAIIGSTRLWNLERWAWKPGHIRYGLGYPDACEIGYTWLNRSAIRSPANTESKLLLLKLAFEKWNAFSVCLHSDSRNSRSRAAIERIGAKFEGILRAHRLAVDNIPRDSARYSIIASEWPFVKMHLEKLLERK